MGLDKIRTPQKADSIQKQILIPLGILLLGIGLGTFSKFLDYRQAQLPVLLQTIDDSLDFHNFLGGFAPWIVTAVCISVYSRTPARAALNVFLFFTGMVSGYYLYCYFVAGFFPRSYALIWIMFTIASPFLAFLCWYAKGDGFIAFLLSSGIIGTLINTAFLYGVFYVDIRSCLHVVTLILGVFILRRSPKETAAMIGAGIVFAVIINEILPFHIW